MKFCKPFIFVAATLLMTTQILSAAGEIKLPDTQENINLVNELSMLDDLIRITASNLKNQETLRAHIVEYQSDLSLYLKNSSNKEIVLKVAKKAYLVLEEIKENHLLTSFEPDFISELTLFSQIALKKGIPKP